MWEKFALLRVVGYISKFGTNLTIQIAFDQRERNERVMNREIERQTDRKRMS